MQIIIHNKAVSNQARILSFYEFPVQYSEYNSMDIEQYRDAPWFKKYPPERKEVEAVVLDDFLPDGFFTTNTFVKIDVEGAEFLVVQGMKHKLKTKNPVIILEYVEPLRSNTSHQKALSLLKELEYIPNIIHADGTISIVEHIDDYLAKNQLESENLVFVKRTDL